MNAWAQVDPLEGLEARPLETQVAVMATELRNQRNMLGGVVTELQGVRKALMTAALSVTGGLIVFAGTIYGTFH